ncbi:unnamed protein product [Mytilus coruscus]|uniref:Uncharacterized protein n=1 Tax=Mytilus coruscus TaxID=42192 RepID=A0A6J8AD96_MYTCO|nr:unnamed protein product [Mytilus coruscus]
MEKNDISIRPAKRQVILGNNTVYTYGSVQNTSEHHTVQRAHVLRAPSQYTTIWPGDFIEMQLPPDIWLTDDSFAIEPRLESHISSIHAGKDSNVWHPPNLITSVAGRIRIPNLTQEPHSLRRNEHFCQIRSTYVPECKSDAFESAENNDKIKHPRLTNYSESVIIDPDNLLSQEIKVKFRDTLKNYDDVFDPYFKGYNGAAGPFQARVNMGPVQPPQRKGRVPQYSRNQLVELQQKFDEFESINIFKRPEDIGVSVENVNPSFLDKKPNGSFRLVTTFADVGRHSKPQPSLMPDVDSTLQEGVVAKITDDLYCGGNTQLELLQNWTRVLQALQKSSLNLSATKTIIAPKSTTILGWIWQLGTIRANPHRISTLSVCLPPAKAFEKLCRGEFSASPRVWTFLSTACRYQVTVRHVAGAAILPSDFASRNAPDCEDSACQICTFMQFTENSVVRHISTKDILEGIQKPPFTSRNAWISIQTECSDKRRTHAHLRQGTRPSKKLTNVKDIKRYLNNA